MGRFVEGADRSQLSFLPECLDDGRLLGGAIERPAPAIKTRRLSGDDCKDPPPCTGSGQIDQADLP